MRYFIVSPANKANTGLDVDAAPEPPHSNRARQLLSYGEGQFHTGDAPKRVQIDNLAHNGMALLGYLAVCA